VSESLCEACGGPMAVILRAGTRACSYRCRVALASCYRRSISVSPRMGALIACAAAARGISACALVEQAVNRALDVEERDA
jgi:hypothetical protein